MRVGWIQDRPGYDGGAEITAREFRAAAPPEIEIIDCYPGQIERDVHTYVVHNCTQFADGLIEYLAPRRTIKYVHDMWPHGDETLKVWLLRHAHLVFCSSPQQQRFQAVLNALRHPYMENTVHVITPAIDYERFRLSRDRGQLRSGIALYLGAIKLSKGIHEAILWATEKKVALDFWGRIHEPVAYRLIRSAGPSFRYRGEICYEDVPELLNGYQALVHLPYEFEPFGRSVAEAWMTGMVVEMNDLVGFQSWVDSGRIPGDFQDGKIQLTTAASSFWNLVRSLVEQ